MDLDEITYENMLWASYIIKVGVLHLVNRQLTVLPELLKELRRLHCDMNKLTTLPELPKSLETLSCVGNQLTILPELPKSLETLFCSYNQLTILPELPKSLKTLFCSDNQLITLPKLPKSLIVLFCKRNQLTTLPILPESLENLECQDNPLPFFELKKWKIFDRFRLTYHKVRLAETIYGLLKMKILKGKGYRKIITWKNVHKEIKTDYYLNPNNPCGFVSELANKKYIIEQD